MKCIIKIELIVDSPQFKSTEESEQFIRSILLDYEGTQYFTKWCVVKAEEIKPTK